MVIIHDFFMFLLFSIRFRNRHLLTETDEPEIPYYPRLLPGFRPSQNTVLNSCFLKSLTPQQQREMSSCFTQCLQNPCCQAVNITNCEWSNVKTEESDFVREVGEMPYDSISLTTEYVVNRPYHTRCM